MAEKFYDVPGAAQRDSSKRKVQPMPENPLLAALALADELRPVIIEGTRSNGTWDAAVAIDELRSERDRELSGK